MSRPNDTQNWRTRVGWLVGQLFVIFLGVSAAFVVENYRETLSQREELHQALVGIITEMERYETRSVQFADAFDAATERWAAADREGRRAVPGYYRIPGAAHPPTAAWKTAVTSGIARMIEPKLRVELGYFYSEFNGIHAEPRPVQRIHRTGNSGPRLAGGPDAFYGSDGKLLPMFRVHMDLQNEFAADLRRLGQIGARASRAARSSAGYQVIPWRQRCPRLIHTNSERTRRTQASRSHPRSPAISAQYSQCGSLESSSQRRQLTKLFRLPQGLAGSCTERVRSRLRCIRVDHC